MGTSSTRAKWRALRSARVSTLKKCLTESTLSETPVFDNLPELEWETSTSMHLFHHITVFSLSEQEKKAFVEAGVEFTRTMNTSRGETVMFDTGENDPCYETVAALLRSLDPKRVRDFSMTVPTLREFISKMVADGRERLKQEAAVLAQWPRGREVLRESLELMRSGKRSKHLMFGPCHRRSD